MGKKLMQKAGLVGLPGQPGAVGGAAATGSGGVPAAGAAGGVGGVGGLGGLGGDTGPAGAGSGDGHGIVQGAGSVVDPALPASGPGRSKLGLARAPAAGPDGRGLAHPMAEGSGVRPAGGAVGLGPSEAPRAKTAPGTMLGFMAAQSVAIQEAEQLKQRLADFEGALPARRLDPAQVRPSAWANRHAASYEDAAFAQLKAEIASAGGNVQPVKVRPLRLGKLRGGLPLASSGAVAAAAVAGPQPADQGPAYEIVFGHRRHRACLDLGLPLLAIVEDLNEQQLFEQMERENRQRKDLSAWEQGMMYARALDQGLYPSNRQLALAIGRDLGDIGKALALARLPPVVVQAFRTPLDLQFRWARPLADAQQRDPEGLVARAESLRGRQGSMAARQVFEVLVGTAVVGAAAPGAAGVSAAGSAGQLPLVQGRRTLGLLSWDAAGRTTVRIDPVLQAAQREQLALVIAECLARAAAEPGS